MEWDLIFCWVGLGRLPGRDLTEFRLIRRHSKREFNKSWCQEKGVRPWDLTKFGQGMGLGLGKLEKQDLVDFGLGGPHECSFKNISNSD